MGEQAKQITTIAVSSKTKKRLEMLRKELGVRTYDDLINRLLESVNLCRDFMVKEKVVKALCNDLAETKAVLSVWSRLLSKKFDSKDEIAVALQYLIPSPDDPQIFVVNKEICVSVEHMFKKEHKEKD